MRMSSMSILAKKTQLKQPGKRKKNNLLKTKRMLNIKFQLKAQFLDLACQGGG